MPRTAAGRIANLLLLVIVTVLLNACDGGGQHVKFGVHAAATPTACGAQVPIGHGDGRGAAAGGRMGICAPTSIKKVIAPAKRIGPRVAVTGPQTLGLDVSSYDGCPTFAGASFVIAKDGEGGSWTDPTLACHIAAAKARGIPWGVYYFERPGCQSCQADREVDLVARFGQPPLGYTVDDEVGVGASGTQQFVNELYARTHRIPVRYTSPGLCTGAVHGAYLWIADYALSFSSCANAPVLAWQFSDGVFGPGPHSIGGHQGDIDQDRGLIAAERPGPPPKPVLRCFGPGAQVHNSTCARARTAAAHAYAARWASHRAYDRHGCPALRRQRTLHAYHKRDCQLWAGRVAYFNRRFQTIEHTTYH